MKKRIGIIVALLCALSMTACGGRKAAEPGGAQIQEQAAETAASSAIVENAASGDAESDMGKTKDSAETAGEKVATVEQQLLDAGRIPVQVESHFQEVPGEEEDGVDILSQVKYQKLQLTEEASGLYPELEQALEAYSERRETEMKSALGTLAVGAREGLQQGWINREFYIPFFSEAETEILRADSRVFSFCTNGGDYAGGAHPNSSFYTQTLDPQTGEIIPTGQRGRKRKERPAEDPTQVEARVAAASAGYLEKIQQQELTIRQQQTQITELNKRIAQMEETISKAAAILGMEKK